MNAKRKSGWNIELADPQGYQGHSEVHGTGKLLLPIHPRLLKSNKTFKHTGRKG